MWSNVQSLQTSGLLLKACSPPNHANLLPTCYTEKKIKGNSSIADTLTAVDQPLNDFELTFFLWARFRIDYGSFVINVNHNKSLSYLLGWSTFVGFAYKLFSYSTLMSFLPSLILLDSVEKKKKKVL